MARTYRDFEVIEVWHIARGDKRGRILIEHKHGYFDVSRSIDWSFDWDGHRLGFTRLKEARKAAKELAEGFAITRVE